MITGNIKDRARYYGISKNIDSALNFLATLDKNAVGSYQTDDFTCFFSTEETSDVENDGNPKKYEAHRKYVDIHFVLDGLEGMGYANIKNLSALTEYNEEEDFLLLSGELNKIVLHEGEFFIAFPEDAHIPGLCCGENKKLKKAIVKIKL